MKPGIPGKRVVAVLYGGALLLCAALLWYGLGQRKPREAVAAEPGPPPRNLLLDYPDEWTRISYVEGQGWVRFVPCGSEEGALRIETGPQGSRLHCRGCDSVGEAAVLGAAPAEASGGLRLEVDVGESVRLEPVDSAVAARFQGAPVRDYVLTWKLSPASAMYFVPALQAGSFEILRAEDESPEGCGELGIEN